MGGQKPAPGWAVVTAVCCAIDGLARGLALDLAPVRVNVVHPGAVKTEWFDMFPAEQLEGVLQYSGINLRPGLLGSRRIWRRAIFTS